MKSSIPVLKPLLALGLVATLFLSLVLLIRFEMRGIREDHEAVISRLDYLAERMELRFNIQDTTQRIQTEKVHERLSSAGVVD